MKKIVRQKGFTLIELLVVIVIVAVLGMIGTTSYQSVNQRSRDARRMADMEQVRAALEMYRADQAPPSYVACASGFFDSCLTSDLDGSYLSGIPQDPLYPKHRYVYGTVDSGITYSLYYYSEVDGIYVEVKNPL